MQAGAEMYWHRIPDTQKPRPEIMSGPVQDQQAMQERRHHKGRRNTQTLRRIRPERDTLTVTTDKNSLKWRAITLSSVICALLGLKPVTEGRRSDLPPAKPLMTML